MTDKQPIYAELPADRYSKSGNVTDTGWFNIHAMRAFADATHALRTQALAAQAPRPVADALREAAQAVIDRWETPLWKDVPATAEYIGRLRAALAAQAPQPGYVLVPVEPTTDQEWAGKQAALRGSTMAEACKIYKAMLAAAPKAPQQEAVALLPEHLTLAVDQWFAQNTGLGGCSDKDVAQLAAIFYGVTYDGGRESVDDALAVVESFGPGIEGLNDTYARQVILAQEVLRLHGECMRSMDSHQTTRNALRAALDHIDMNALRISHCKDAAAIDAAQAYRQVAPAMPPGWVPCTIEFDGSGPEEVAYGPKIMMDRLGKWLRKYFDHVVASKAQPAPTPQADSQPAADPQTAEVDRYNLMGLLAECHDAFPLPEIDSQLENQWMAAMGNPAEVPGYLRAVSEAMQDRANLLASELAAARAQADSVLEDAARYRWLRDENEWYFEPRLDAEDGTVWRLTFYTPAQVVDVTDDDSLNASIDAARKEGK